MRFERIKRSFVLDFIFRNLIWFIGLIMTIWHVYLGGSNIPLMIWYGILFIVFIVVVQFSGIKIAIMFIYDLIRSLIISIREKRDFELDIDDDKKALYEEAKEDILYVFVWAIVIAFSYFLLKPTISLAWDLFSGFISLIWTAITSFIGWLIRGGQ